ncbi:uncharacterized protein LOC112127960 [Cimex lectularius]|uniref:Uncharacterized protein n=1 Tax=Cimex lectularius TaxID=79782 RepID=A0A8I6SSX6_CIMLE|nr:uncharacterized protein LOC112127960 [Cimex lectularius]
MPFFRSTVPSRSGHHRILPWDECCSGAFLDMKKADIISSTDFSSLTATKASTYFTVWVCSLTRRHRCPSGKRLESVTVFSTLLIYLPIPTGYMKTLPFCTKDLQAEEFKTFSAA